ncbi:MAG: hypothetical protein KKA65_02240 [Nanoarchaeota archaeon]|nr:hypothetical protein [Nanoarchaeota archaeon]MBU4456296.1 hypothetical protein [Nanoarchaeota archaeon]MCG2719513.1 hypothetical protein [Nanoarchaeota archaeon]
MEERREILVNYVKDALSKGYSESVLRKHLLDNGVSWVEAASILTVAKTELGLNGNSKEEIVEKPQSGLPPVLIALAGLFGMIIIYFYRMLNGMFNYSVLGDSLNAVWPLVFPIMSNMVNLVFFRKKFLFSLILTLVVIIILAMILTILPLIGI